MRSAFEEDIDHLVESQYGLKYAQAELQPKHVGRGPILRELDGMLEITDERIKRNYPDILHEERPFIKYYQQVIRSRIESLKEHPEDNIVEIREFVHDVIMNLKVIRELAKVANFDTKGHQEQFGRLRVKKAEKNDVTNGRPSLEHLCAHATISWNAKREVSGETTRMYPWDTDILKNVLARRTIIAHRFFPSMHDDYNLGFYALHQTDDGNEILEFAAADERGVAPQMAGNLLSQALHSTTNKRLLNVLEQTHSSPPS